ncbi:hypothetical protein DAI22_11g191900 [Oryza sativa Japonica Group]|nr:hypothetical protein DAI22_11g191900 [Oryza sativa Japonica Group]
MCYQHSACLAAIPFYSFLKSCPLPLFSLFLKVPPVVVDLLLNLLPFSLPPHCRRRG